MQILSLLFWVHIPAEPLIGCMTLSMLKTATYVSYLIYRLVV